MGDGELRIGGGGGVEWSGVDGEMIGLRRNLILLNFSWSHHLLRLYCTCIVHVKCYALYGMLSERNKKQKYTKAKPHAYKAMYRHIYRYYNYTYLTKTHSAPFYLLRVRQWISFLFYFVLFFILF